MKEFLRRKNIIFSAKRYGIDALSAMAQGLFASLTYRDDYQYLGEQLGIDILVTVGTYAKGATGAAMAISIGYALQCPPLVLFSLTAVAWRPMSWAVREPAGSSDCNYFCGGSRQAGFQGDKNRYYCNTFCIYCRGCTVVSLVGTRYRLRSQQRRKCHYVATELQPFFMGILVSVIVGIALTLPISSAAICAALSLTGLAGGAAVAGCCARWWALQ